MRPLLLGRRRQLLGRRRQLLLLWCRSAGNCLLRATGSGLNIRSLVEVHVLVLLS
jgi:hypothetical protein